MRTAAIDRNARFQPIRGAAVLSGFSMKYVRAGCKDGTIPHKRVGTDYRIDMWTWNKQLDAEMEGSSAQIPAVCNWDDINQNRPAGERDGV